MLERNAYQRRLMVMSMLPELKLQDDVGVVKGVRKVLKRDQSQLVHARNALKLAEHIIPGAERLIARNFSTKRLPADNMSLHAFGAEHSVFIDSEKTHVMKVDRFSLGLPHYELMEYAADKRGQFNALCKTFAGMDMVAQTSYLLVHSHVFNKPALAHVQRFQTGLRDLFTSFTVNELRELAYTHETFAKQLDYFATNMNGVSFEGKKFMVDYLGHGNICVTPENKLTIIDPSITRVHLPHANGFTRKLKETHESFLRAVLQ